ncbi:putative transposase domain protein [Neisseria meningitidis NM3081]|nr:putative transposase domain protein [Neisseria meningitidis NM3081]
MPALCAYRFNAFPKLINNLKKAGKPKMVIIVAIMRKLAKLAYYIVKTGQPYDDGKTPIESIKFNKIKRLREYICVTVHLHIVNKRK